MYPEALQVSGLLMRAAKQISSSLARDETEEAIGGWCSCLYQSVASVSGRPLPEMLRTK